VYRPCGGTDIISGMARTGGSALKQDVKVGVFVKAMQVDLHICSHFVLSKLTKNNRFKRCDSEFRT
jgi:hypothetical protein